MDLGGHNTGGSIHDGAFERFLTSAIATIITIIFSWRLLTDQRGSSTTYLLPSPPEDATGSPVDTADHEPVNADTAGREETSENDNANSACGERPEAERQTMANIDPGTQEKIMIMSANTHREESPSNMDVPDSIPRRGVASTGVAREIRTVHAPPTHHEPQIHWKDYLNSTDDAYASDSASDSEESSEGSGDSSSESGRYAFYGPTLEAITEENSEDLKSSDDDTSTIGEVSELDTDRSSEDETEKVCDGNQGNSLCQATHVSQSCHTFFADDSNCVNDNDAKTPTGDGPNLFAKKGLDTDIFVTGSDASTSGIPAENVTCNILHGNNSTADTECKVLSVASTHLSTPENNAVQSLDAGRVAIETDDSLHESKSAQAGLGDDSDSNIVISETKVSDTSMTSNSKVVKDSLRDNSGTDEDLLNGKSSTFTDKSRDNITVTKPLTADDRTKIKDRQLIALPGQSKKEKANHGDKCEKTRDDSASSDESDDSDTGTVIVVGGDQGLSSAPSSTRTSISDYSDIICDIQPSGDSSKPNDLPETPCLGLRLDDKECAQTIFKDLQFPASDGCKETFDNCFTNDSVRLSTEIHDIFSTSDQLKSQSEHNGKNSSNACNVGAIAPQDSGTALSDTREPDLTTSNVNDTCIITHSGGKQITSTPLFVIKDSKQTGNVDENKVTIPDLCGESPPDAVFTSGSHATDSLTRARGGSKQTSLVGTGDTEAAVDNIAALCKSHSPVKSGHSTVGNTELSIAGPECSRLNETVKNNITGNNSGSPGAKPERVISEHRVGAILNFDLCTKNSSTYPAADCTHTCRRAGDGTTGSTKIPSIDPNTQVLFSGSSRPEPIAISPCATVDTDVKYASTGRDNSDNRAHDSRAEGRNIQNKSRGLINQRTYRDAHITSTGELPPKGFTFNRVTARSREFYLGTKTSYTLKTPVSNEITRQQEHGDIHSYNDKENWAVSDGSVLKCKQFTFVIPAEVNEFKSACDDNDVESASGTGSTCLTDSPTGGAPSSGTASQKIRTSGGKAQALRRSECKGSTAGTAEPGAGNQLDPNHAYNEHSKPESCPNMGSNVSMRKHDQEQFAIRDKQWQSNKGDNMQFYGFHSGLDEPYKSGVAQGRQSSESCPPVISTDISEDKKLTDNSGMWSPHRNSPHGALHSQETPLYGKKTDASSVIMNSERGGSLDRRRAPMYFKEFNDRRSQPPWYAPDSASGWHMNECWADDTTKTDTFNESETWYRRSNYNDVTGMSDSGYGDLEGDRALVRHVTRDSAACTAIATSTALARREVTFSDTNDIDTISNSIVSAVASAEATGINPYIAVARATARAATMASANATSGVAEHQPDSNRDINVVISTSCTIKGDDTEKIMRDSEEVIQALGDGVRVSVHTIKGTNYENSSLSSIPRDEPHDDLKLNEARKRLKISLENGEGRKAKELELALPNNLGERDAHSIISDAVNRVLFDQSAQAGAQKSQIHDTVDMVTKKVIQAYGRDHSSPCQRGLQGNPDTPSQPASVEPLSPEGADYGEQLSPSGPGTNLNQLWTDAQKLGAKYLSSPSGGDYSQADLNKVPDTTKTSQMNYQSHNNMSMSEESSATCFYVTGSSESSLHNKYPQADPEHTQNMDLSNSGVHRGVTPGNGYYYAKTDSIRSPERNVKTESPRRPGVLCNREDKLISNPGSNQPARNADDWSAVIPGQSCQAIGRTQQSLPRAASDWTARNAADIHQRHSSEPSQQQGSSDNAAVHYTSTPHRNKSGPPSVTTTGHLNYKSNRAGLDQGLNSERGSIVSTNSTFANVYSDASSQPATGAGVHSTDCSITQVKEGHASGQVITSEPSAAVSPLRTDFDNRSVKGDRDGFVNPDNHYSKSQSSITGIKEIEFVEPVPVAHTGTRSRVVREHVTLPGKSNRKNEMAVSKQSYTSILQTPVTDVKTPLHLQQQYEAPEKDKPVSRLKINEARKGYLNKQGVMTPEPVSQIDREFEKRKSFRNASGTNRPNFVIVDIDIDSKAPPASSRVQCLKQNLDRIRPRAPVNSYADKAWKIPQFKVSKSQEMGLNETPDNTVTFCAAKSAENLVRTPSITSLAKQFFSDSKSCTSLLETDIDTGLHTEVPLVQETDVDKVWSQKAASMTNLCNDKLKSVEITDWDRTQSADILQDDNHSGQNSQSGNDSISETNIDQSKSAHEIQIANSLHRLDIPQWYRSFRRPKSPLSNSDKMFRPIKDTSQENVTRENERPKVDTKSASDVVRARPVVIRHRVTPTRRLSPSSSSRSSTPLTDSSFELPSTRIRKNSNSALQRIQIKPKSDLLSQTPSPKADKTLSAREKYLRMKGEKQFDVKPIQTPPKPSGIAVHRTPDKNIPQNFPSDRALKPSNIDSVTVTDYNKAVQADITDLSPVTISTGAERTNQVEQLDPVPANHSRAAQHTTSRGPSHNNTSQDGQSKKSDSMLRGGNATIGLNNHKGITETSKSPGTTGNPRVLSPLTGERQLDKYFNNPVLGNGGVSAFHIPNTTSVVDSESRNNIHADSVKPKPEPMSMKTGNDERKSNEMDQKHEKLQVNDSERSADRFPVLSYAWSPRSRRKFDSDSPSRARRELQIKLTDTKRPDFVNASDNDTNSTRTGTSLDEVLDDLLALQKKANQTSESTSLEQEEHPPSRTLQFLKQVETPQSSLNSISTPRSSDSGTRRPWESSRSTSSKGTPVKERFYEPPLVVEGEDGLSEDKVIVKCRNQKCGKSENLEEARLSYKTCHNCYTYYCSRDCRKAHWERHKRKCMYSRVNSTCKHIIKKIHDSSDYTNELSRIARTGYLSCGRGCVMLVFSELEEAERFLHNGTGVLSVPASYTSVKELENADVLGEHAASIIEMCKMYNPEIKFVIDVSIVSGQEVPAKPLPRREGPTIHKCAKLRLSSVITSGGAHRVDESETLILTAVPGSEFTENMEERKAREVCFINIQRKLRQKGVSLRHHYPDVYSKLCAYVASQEHFTPIIIYPYDRHKGKRFMCVIMPEAEPEVEWLQAPDLLEELGLSTEV